LDGGLKGPIFEKLIEVSSEKEHGYNQSAVLSNHCSKGDPIRSHAQSHHKNEIADYIDDIGGDQDHHG
jgi:hypothetical protein